MYHQEARFYQLIKQRGYLSQEDEADYLRLLTGLHGAPRGCRRPGHDRRHHAVAVLLAGPDHELRDGSGAS